MKTDIAPVHTLTHQGIETINAIVETLPASDAHIAIARLREHLEARAEQTAPREDDFADLIGV